MIKDIEQAHAALADALWWLKGFGAIKRKSAATDLSEQLREVRIWLGRITDGYVRRLGDEKVVVITYGDFERLFDGLRENATDADRADGRAAAEMLLSQYGAEAREARNAPDIPF